MKEHVIDAKDKRLGRVASEIAVILQGKNDPSYDPKDASDNKVIVKNINEIQVTGKKAKGDGKIYYKHTGYIGNLKKRTFEQMFSKNPEWVLKQAVKGMLPKNKLRSIRIKNLVVEK